MSSIPERLKQYRKYLRKTQKEMTKFLGLVNQSTYGHYEIGSREIPQNVLLILQEQGLNIEWLLTGKGIMTNRSVDSTKIESNADFILLKEEHENLKKYVIRLETKLETCQQYCSDLLDRLSQYQNCCNMAERPKKESKSGDIQAIATARP